MQSKAKIALVLAIGIAIGVLLRQQMREFFDQKDPMLDVLKKILDPVHPIIKDLDLYKDKKAYTLNKKKIYLCLYDKDGKYYPQSTLVYVLLHEVAHMLNTKDKHHTPAFYAEFDRLLARATELGVYNPAMGVDESYSLHND